MKKMNGQNTGRHYIAAFLLLAALVVLLPLNAAGKGWKLTDPSWTRAEGDRFVLNFGDSYISGDHDIGTTLHLKRVLMQQYPGLDVSDLRLRKVVLVAKTRRGGGFAQLKVGPESSDMHRVAGHPRIFDRSDNKSFDRITIDSPFHDGWGPWQLQLRGTFKIREVVVFVERRSDRHYGKHPHDRHQYDRPRVHHREPDRLPDDFTFRDRW